jgi:hypothetical protein
VAAALTGMTTVEVSNCAIVNPLLLLFAKPYKMKRLRNKYARGGADEMAPLKYCNKKREFRSSSE